MNMGAFLHLTYQTVVESRRLVWKTAIAAGIAWQLARLTGTSRPYFAPLAAILCMQVTVEESFLRGYQRVLGIVGGILVADVTARYLGVHAWSIALIVFIGVLGANMLKLGPQATPQVGVSALMVLTLGVGNQSYALDRIVETVIGVVVSVLVNMLVLPPDFTEQARHAMVWSAEELAKRYMAIADWLARGANVNEGKELRHPTRGYIQSVHETVEKVDQALKGLRFNPLVRRKTSDLTKFERQLVRLRQEYAHVTGMMRTLVEWSDSGLMTESDALEWSQRMRDMSTLIVDWKRRLEIQRHDTCSPAPDTTFAAIMSTSKDGFETALKTDARQMVSDFMEEMNARESKTRW